MKFFGGGGRDCVDNYYYNNFFLGGGWVEIVRSKMPVTRRGSKGQVKSVI